MYCRTEVNPGEYCSNCGNKIKEDNYSENLETQTDIGKGRR